MYALTVIVQIVVIVCGVSLPVLGTLAYLYYHGNTKFQKASQLAAQAIEYIASYFDTNPDAAKTRDLIFNLFKARLEAVLPLSDDEVMYLFDAFKQAIANALNVPVSIFDAPAGNKLSVPVFYGRKRLFK